MRICFLIADISARGGTERVTSIIANGLLKRKYEVDIISCRNEPESYFELNQNIKVHSLRAENIRNTFRRKCSNYEKIWKLAYDRKYDVVIAVDIYLYLYLIPLQITRKSKCIAWEHFTYYFSSMKQSRLARKLAVKFAYQVVVLSKNDLDNYRNNYKDADNITYIYNPTALKKSTNRNINKHRIIAAGRLSEEKGFDLLIDAWNIIEKKDRNSDWILDIYGTGELESQLANQINKHELKRVHLRGYADNIESEYLESSIFVLSSRYEGFGLVLVEALACGVPCVSFNCPEGPAEIISDNVNGYLVENGNINQLADKIMKLMHDEKLRKSFSENAYRDLKRFELQEVLNRWEEVLHRI